MTLGSELHTIDIILQCIYYIIILLMSGDSIAKLSGSYYAQTLASATWYHSPYKWLYLVEKLLYGPTYHLNKDLFNKLKIFLMLKQLHNNFYA